mmetsp:Transcript_25789/g.53623  ORF Transcript_25789/g.53623 Transcript_25789/m.53623 type:complete len:459 (+) Transcript_25789:88-1464(+)
MPRRKTGKASKPEEDDAAAPLLQDGGADLEAQRLYNDEGGTSAVSMQSSLGPGTEGDGDDDGEMKSQKSSKRGSRSRLISGGGTEKDDMTRWDAVLWWFIGTLNNISFVICAASAKDILPTSVGVVYLANSFPSLIIRLSAPYWFDMVSYELRMFGCFVMFISGFGLVALAPGTGLKLVGVMLVSSQCGLGETSMLALQSRYGNTALTAWSSGTGAAGILGYFYVVLVNRWIGLSSESTLLIACCFGLLYYATFLQFTIPPPPTMASEDFDSLNTSSHNLSLTMSDRLRLTLSLWKWGVPLIVVYFAEYAMQSGTWSAIGIPDVSDADQRATFYQNANWCYQVGVLLSRSSGMLWRPSLSTLWVMPIAQVGLLVASTLNAAEHWWYDNSLLLASVVVGLFGGAVYVNGFRMIGEEVNADVRELAIAAAAVSCDIGTNIGEGVGVLVQSWIYTQNGIKE